MSSPSSPSHPLPTSAPAAGRPNGEINGETAIEDKKRRYSLEIFQYTNDQWQEVRKAMEQRRGSVSGSEAASSIQSSPIDSESSNPVARAGNAETAAA